MAGKRRGCTGGRDKNTRQLDEHDKIIPDVRVTQAQLAPSLEFLPRGGLSLVLASEVNWT